MVILVGVFVPARAREARLTAGLTQEGLADRMTAELRRRNPDRWAMRRVRERNIVRWEKGDHDPNPMFLEVLALATRREISFFFGDDDDEQEAAQVERGLSLLEDLQAAIAYVSEQMRNGART